MEKKKAISDIVSTVLIIMIAVAAVGIIGAIIVPMVRNSLQAGTVCLEVTRDLEIAATDSCYTLGNTTSNTTVKVAVRRGTGNYNLAELTLHAIDNQGNSIPHAVNLTGNNLESGASRSYNFNMTSNTTVVSAVSWTAKVNVGNTQQSCGDPSAGRVYIQQCRN